MAARDSFRKFELDDAAIARLQDRERADREIGALASDTDLKEEIRELKAIRKNVSPMVAEKGEAAQASYAPEAAAIGSVPSEHAPKVKVAAATDAMSKDELAKLRIHTGPAPVNANTDDPRLVETNIVREKKSYTQEERAAARAQADAIFAASAPGSKEFMRGIAICQAFDLKLPDVDVDAIQARADEAVRAALVEGAKPKPRSDPPAGAPGGGGLARLQPHLNLQAANAPRPEEPTHEDTRERSPFLWALLPVAIVAGVILWFVLARDPGPDAPLSVPVTAAHTAPVPTPIATEAPTVPVTADPIETAAPPPTAFPTAPSTMSIPTSTNVAPPDKTARPVPSSPVTATPAPTTAPSTSSTRTVPVW